MREEFSAMSARWENEKSAIGKVQHLREEIEQVNGEIARAEREYDLNRAAELKYGRLPALQKELKSWVPTKSWAARFSSCTSKG